MKKFLYIPSLGLTIVAPPKCGRSSVAEALSDYDTQAVYAEAIEGNVIFIVREPLARFKSLWRNKCRDKGRLKGQEVVYGMTPRELLTHIARGTNPNDHWATQQEILDRIPGGCPLWVLRLESLAKELPHANRTEGVVPMSIQLRLDVLAYYAADVKLYKGADRL